MMISKKELAIKFRASLSSGHTRAYPPVDETMHLFGSRYVYPFFNSSTLPQPNAVQQLQLLSDAPFYPVFAHTTCWHDGKGGAYD